MWASGSTVGAYSLLRRVRTSDAGCLFLAERTGPLGFRRHVEIAALHTQLSESPAHARAFALGANLFAHSPHVRLVPVEDVGVEHGRLYRVGAVPAAWSAPDWMQELRASGIVLSVSARCLVAAEVAAACTDLQTEAERLDVDAPLGFRTEDIVIARDGRVRIKCPLPSLALGKPVPPGADAGRLGALLRRLLDFDRSVDKPLALGAALSELLSRSLCRDERQRPPTPAAFRAELLDAMGGSLAAAAGELVRAARRLGDPRDRLGGEGSDPNSEDLPTAVFSNPRGRAPLGRSAALSSRLRLQVVGASGQLPLSPPASRWVVGRDARADLVLSDPDVSREHFEVVRAADGGFALYDLGSKNGVRVNGQPVDERKLCHGDEILAGSTRLRVER